MAEKRNVKKLLNDHIDFLNRNLSRLKKDLLDLPPSSQILRKELIETREKRKKEIEELSEIKSLVLDMELNPNIAKIVINKMLNRGKK